jgi:probable rRNA maturation factor
MTIAIVEDTSLLGLNRRKLRRRLAAALKYLGLEGRGLTVLTTDDEGIRELNKRFRGLDESTNVLAFPDTDQALGLDGYLGDLALSVQTLRRESEERGQDLGYLLHFYLIHGLLHLIGHDHEKGPEDELKQNEETIKIMSMIKHDL